MERAFSSKIDSLFEFEDCDDDDDDDDYDDDDFYDFNPIEDLGLHDRAVIDLSGKKWDDIKEVLEDGGLVYIGDAKNGEPIYAEAVQFVH